MIREIALMLLSIFLLLGYGSGCALWGSKDPNEIDTLAPDDIVLGMNMNDVMRAWGEPSNVYQAGGRDQGHQKWIYQDSSLQHIDPNSARVIYFENGQVIGWESATGQGG